MGAVFGRIPNWRMSVVVRGTGKLREPFADILAENPREFAQSGGFGDEEVGTCAEAGLPVGFHGGGGEEGHHGVTDLGVGMLPEASNQAGAGFIGQMKIHQEGVADMALEGFDGVGSGRGLMDFETGEMEVFGDDTAVDGIVLDEQYAGTFGDIGWVHGHGFRGWNGLM
jgi:hypothetical protein